MRTLVLFMVLVVAGVYATHYRGGTFYWERLGNKHIRIFWRLAFEKKEDFFDEYFCDSIGQQRESETSLALTCTDCRENKIISSPLNIKCSFTSEEMKWSLFDGYVDYKADREVFTLAFKTKVDCKDSSWIYLQNYGTAGGKCWSLITKVDTSIILNNNSPRVMAGLPVHRVRQGCNRVIDLNPIDIDGDPVKCRWTSTKECPERRSDTPYNNAPVCGRPTDFTTLNTTSCTIEFNTGEDSAEGWYAASVMIEDFEDESYKIAKSTVPFQFLLKVTSPGSCIVPKIEIEHCFEIGLGETWSSTVTASIQTGSDAKIIKEIQASGKGLKIDDINPGKKVTAKVSFLPEAKGTYVFSFTAIDDNGVQSDPTSARVHVSSRNPVKDKQPAPSVLPEESTPAKASLYEGTEDYWTVKFNTNIRRPEKKSFIEIKENGTTNLVRIAKYNVRNKSEVTFPKSDPTILQFPAPTGLEGGKSYFVFVDEGAAVKDYSGLCHRPATKNGASSYPFTIPKPPEPEVECGNSKIKVRIPRTYVNNIPASELHLHDKKCRLEEIEDNPKYYKVDFSYYECGTSIKRSSETHTNFYNTIRDDPTPIVPGALVTREQHNVEVEIICEMIGDGIDVRFKTVHTTTPVKYKATGQFKAYLKMYEDSAYRHVISGTASVNIDDVMYFAAISTSSKNVAIDSCKAMNTLARETVQEYTFIQDGCGIDQSVVISSSGLDHRFSIKSFEFMDRASDEILVKCKIISCNDLHTESRCATLKDDQYCSSKGRRRRGNRIGTFEDETNAFMTFKM
ncbi:uncharacterized protein [Antedon mediterranea]|uniref:uncharacterized protein n=1 Tax=Antedon mediterranea TaxID=105859 RepID=UPI003AF734B1